MNLIWLGNGDPNVCEDYILPGLVRIGCNVDVRPWKRSFDEVRDPARHGGHGYTIRLGGEMPRVHVDRPDAIVVCRGWGDRPFVEGVLDAHPGVPVVFFDGEDTYHGPEWLSDRVVRIFVAQSSRALLASNPKLVALPPCARADLIPGPEEKGFTVVWGGKFGSGHGGRYVLLGPAITAGLLDEVITYAPWNDWMWRILKSRFSISIGGLELTGTNVSYYEAGAAGASLLYYRHGSIAGEPVPGAREFSTPAELVDLCRAAHAGDLQPALSPMELRRFIEAHHSHTARARQFVEHLRALA